MAITFTRVHGESEDNAADTSLAVNTAAIVPVGSLVIVAYVTNDNDASSVTDAAGNTYAKARSHQIPGISTRSGIFYSVTTVEISSAAAITLNMPGNSRPKAMQVWEFAGSDVHASVLDVVTSNGSSFSSSHSTGTTGTTAQADELAFVVWGFDDGGATEGGDAGYTGDDHFGGGFAGAEGATKGMCEYKILTATGTQSAASTASAACGYAACIATFKAGAGGGGGTTYTKAGFAVAGGLVGKGADVFEATEAGRGKAGLVGFGADVFEATATGRATVGLFGYGADAFTVAETGTGNAGLVGYGTDVFTVAETGTGVAGLKGFGADVFTAAETGSGVAGLLGYGADVFTAAETGYGKVGTIGFGADAITWSKTGHGKVGAVGTGVSQYVPAGGGTTYTKTGYATAGLTGAGADAVIYSDTGTGLVGLVATGRRAVVYTETGTAIVNLVATGRRAMVYSDTGYATVGLVGSGFNDSNIIIVTGHYDAPTPAGGMDPGGPTAGHYDAPTPDMVRV